MTLRGGGWLALVLVLGCTGANPAFDPDAGAVSADDDGESSTGRATVSDAESGVSIGASTSEDSSSGDTDSTGDTGTGNTCSTTAPFQVGTATSVDGERCPSDGFIRGGLVAIDKESFSVRDCGSCDLCSDGAPTWRM